MNEILKNIYDLRVVRKYKKVSMAKDVIDQLLDAGRMAPSVINREPLEVKEKDNVRYIHFGQPSIV